MRSSRRSAPVCRGLPSPSSRRSSSSARRKSRPSRSSHLLLEKDEVPSCGRGGPCKRPATVDHMIEATELTKDYGEKRAVDGITFTVRPGIVTGFLGPNGSGKSTTMRLILGLDAPTKGDVHVNGRHY